MASRRVHETLPVRAALAIGFKFDLRLVAVGLVGHGVFDVFHGGLIDDPGVPHWWPMFCGTFDVTAGAYMVWRLRQRSAASTA
jgi:hypothetical protein